VTEGLWPDSVTLADASAIATELTDALIGRLLEVPPDLEARICFVRFRARAKPAQIETVWGSRFRAPALPAQSWSGGWQGGARRQARDDRRTGGEAPRRVSPVSSAGKAGAIEMAWGSRFSSAGFAGAILV